MAEMYEFVRKIGKGSFGVVNLCKGGDGDLCVVKEIDLSQMSEDEKKGALTEVDLLSTLGSHQYIVHYIESFIKENTLHIVMEYCEGGDLAAKIQQTKKEGKLIEEDQIMKWFVQMALGLHEIHTNRILHRDLKSQNIFLTAAGDAKIGDFGISKVLLSDTEMASTVIGTPYYLSPEICESKPYSKSSDIWALGCILYELTTLKRAFTAKNLLALIGQIRKGRYPPISNIYSKDLSYLIKCMLEQDPERRPSIDQILSLGCSQKAFKAIIGPNADSDADSDVDSLDSLDLETLENERPSIPKITEEKEFVKPKSTTRRKSKLRSENKNATSVRTLSGPRSPRLFRTSSPMKSPKSPRSSLKSPKSNLPRPRSPNKIPPRLKSPKSRSLTPGGRPRISPVLRRSNRTPTRALSRSPTRVKLRQVSKSSPNIKVRRNSTSAVNLRRNSYNNSSIYRKSTVSRPTSPMKRRASPDAKPKFRSSSVKARSSNVRRQGNFSRLRSTPLKTPNPRRRPVSIGRANSTRAAISTKKLSFRASPVKKKGKRYAESSTQAPTQSSQTSISELSDSTPTSGSTLSSTTLSKRFSATKKSATSKVDSALTQEDKRRIRDYQKEHQDLKKQKKEAERQRLLSFKKSVKSAKSRIKNQRPSPFFMRSQSTSVLDQRYVEVSTKKKSEVIPEHTQFRQPNFADSPTQEKPAVDPEAKTPILDKNREEKGHRRSATERQQRMREYMRHCRNKYRVRKEIPFELVLAPRQKTTLDAKFNNSSRPTLSDSDKSIRSLQNTGKSEEKQETRKTVETPSETSTARRRLRLNLERQRRVAKSTLGTEVYERAYRLLRMAYDAGDDNFYEAELKTLAPTKRQWATIDNLRVIIYLEDVLRGE